MSRSVYFISYHFPHIADHSGYDKIARHLGEHIELSRTSYMLGESILRLPAKLVSWYGGQFEYSRHDFVKEYQAYLHMQKHRDCVYHFTQAEKGFKFLRHVKGRRGHRLVGTFHHPPSHFDWLFNETDHLKKLDHAIALSMEQKEYLESVVGIPQVSFVPHGIDTDYFRPLVDVPKKGRLRCLFAGGHLRDFKNLPAVIAGIRSQMDEVDFLMMSRDKRCGDVPQGEHVRWLPDTPDADYLQMMQTSDLLVLPLEESVAVNSVLEALACGLPVVTTQGGVGDYLNDECSVIVARGDTDGVIESSVKLLRDEPLRRSMALAARAQAMTFSWPNVAEMTRTVYEQA